MKIVYLSPGSGGTFYCQNCLRDGALARALKATGSDVVMVPMYLPPFADDATATADTPVFFGAVSLYLKHRFPFLRKLPVKLLNLLDFPAMLRFAASKEGSTRAKGLENMTVSMLMGENGEQSAELDRLVSWLEKEGSPDIIHLSNVLLLGLAQKCRKQLGSRIVCTLQDEHMWVDAMGSTAANRIWQIISEKAENVDAFISVSAYYADRMRKQLNIPENRIHVVYLGISLQGYEQARLSLDPPVIGYLSRVTASLGLDLLVDAFQKLKVNPEFKTLKLRITGGITAGDRKFVRKLTAQLESSGLRDDVEFVDDFNRTGRIDFLKSLSVLSVPVPAGEAFGTHLIEAMAAGVPVVQPRTGAFPELVEATGGGVIYEPNNADTLAATLKSLLLDPERLKSLGRQGKEAVEKRFTIERMAENTLKVYKSLNA